MYILPTVPAVRSIFQDSLGRVRCGWDHLDGICNWAQLWRLCKLFRPAGRCGVGRCGDIPVLCQPKTSLRSKFPYLLKLPSTSLGCLSLSLVSPCSVCVNQYLLLEERKWGRSTLHLPSHPNALSVHTAGVAWPLPRPTPVLLWARLPPPQTPEMRRPQGLSTGPLSFSLVDHFPRRAFSHSSS